MTLELHWPNEPPQPIAHVGLWYWQDDVELTAFEGDDGQPIFLRWQHNGRYVRKEELQRGDHVLFDANGFVLELMRARQPILPPRPATALPDLSIAEQQRRQQLRALILRAYRRPYP